jgi:hypothetical protein
VDVFGRDCVELIFTFQRVSGLKSAPPIADRETD